MSAVIPIVNEQDEIIGYKQRSEVDYTKDIFRTASLWITNSEGQILLAQRSKDKKVDPDKWAEAVGGTVEGTDSYKVTIYREAEEELGVVEEKFELSIKQFVNTPTARYFIQWYTLTLDWPLDNFHPQESEVQKIGWWNPEQLHNIHELVENGQLSISLIPIIESTLE